MHFRFPQKLCFHYNPRLQIISAFPICTRKPCMRSSAQTQVPKLFTVEHKLDTGGWYPEGCFHNTLIQKFSREETFVVSRFFVFFVKVFSAKLFKIPVSGPRKFFPTKHS